MKPSDAFVHLQLFPIDPSEYRSGDPGQWILYSPLAHDFIEVDLQRLNALERQLAEKGRFDDDALQQRLIERRTIPPRNYVASPDEVYAMTLLPNNRCNFSCSYCYAAQGHGHDELSFDTIKAAIDFFVDASRVKRKDLYLSIGGGGEPMLSWDKFKYAVEYSDRLAQQQGLTVHHSFASNGSVVNDDILQTIQKHHIKSNLSFDILEEVQNAQRSNYRQVCETLDRMLDHDIIPTINAVITPLNATRQCEMVEEVHRRFPKLQRLTFDEVIDPKLFDNPDEASRYYDNYTTHFYQARTLGKTYGISVSSIKLHELDCLKPRACGSTFTVTPHGTLSVCFLVSSPKEPHYEDFIYGRIEQGKVVYNSSKFNDLVENSTNQRPQCRHCFIRWHCGGGCYYNTQTFNEEQMDKICDFQRRFSLMGLIQRRNEDHPAQ